MSMPGAKIAAVPFSRIWDSYPSDPPCVDKSGKPPLGWDNQCAVRLGVALASSGVSFASFPAGGRCPVGPASGPMIGSAQKLADWLIQTFLRFTLGISSLPNLNPFTRSEDNPNWFSDLGKSSQIWFWAVS